MYHRSLYCLLIATACVLQLSAQTARPTAISFQFPYFKGKEWFFVVYRGSVNDTVHQGFIPPDGKFTITLPQRYAAHKGIGRWLLKEGGGLEMVLHGQDFTITCLSPTPNDQTIVFTGSPENRFYRQNLQEQQLYLARYNAMLLAANAYPPAHPLYNTFLTEQKTIQAEYRRFRQQLQASPSPAAPYRVINDLTQGIGNTLTPLETEKAKDINDIISNRLNWEALYTSGQWDGVIYNWVQMHLFAIQSDTALLGSARRILRRIENKELYTSFCERMVQQFVRNGKDSLLFALVPDVKNSGRLLHTNGILAQFNSLRPGDQAPDIVHTVHLGNPADHNHKTTVYKAAELSAAYSLLVFYQSGCGPCEQTMQQLTGNYTLLNEKGIRVMSISSDMDLQVFENTARNHPWVDKLCDGEGLQGVNFKNYGVAGTPTLFILDSKGTILRKTASLEEVMKWAGSIKQ